MNVGEEPLPLNGGMLLFGVLSYLAFIVGIVMGKPGKIYDSFSWATAFVWWGGGFISGILIVGFGEIISILHETRYYTYQSYLIHGGEAKAEKVKPTDYELPPNIRI
ncbi:hypothetical protein ACE3MQ_13260 [Paenibacillus lentus]